MHHLETEPSREAELSRDDVLKYFRQMVLIREMELSARELYQQKKIRGFLHLFVGQVNYAVHCMVYSITSQAKIESFAGTVEHAIVTIYNYVTHIM